VKFFPSSSASNKFVCFLLQGPLSKVRSGEENDDSRLWSKDYEGEAVSFFSLAKIQFF